MSSKINLVIFSGSNKLIIDNILINNLNFIANNINIHKYNIWYGGGTSGIMGIIPRKFSERSGQVFSVDSKQFIKNYDPLTYKPEFGISYVMDTFTKRQNKLVSNGDIYLCLPGGVGTISELFDVLVNNDVNNKHSDIIIYSYNDYFKNILDFINDNIKSGYIRKKILDHIFVFNNEKDICDFLNNK
jgi:uncharacterized protein (TIGR00730 family)